MKRKAKWHSLLAARLRVVLQWYKQHHTTDPNPGTIMCTLYQRYRCESGQGVGCWLPDQGWFYNDTGSTTLQTPVWLKSCSYTILQAQVREWSGEQHGVGCWLPNLELYHLDIKRTTLPRTQTWPLLTHTNCGFLIRSQHPPLCLLSTSLVQRCCDCLEGWRMPLLVQLHLPPPLFQQSHL